jgi:predicted RNase H-like nuclease (RuvC/YqgF family)
VTAGGAVGARAPRRNTAVAAVLGAELHSEVRKTEGRGEIDIEVLLRGVEKLNNVYSVPGVPERVQSLRTRYAQIVDSVEHYERKVEKQQRELERMNRGEAWDEDETEADEDFPQEEEVEVTEEDLRREEEEIRELERKKKELEERVTGMERDLGGLLR